MTTAHHLSTNFTSAPSSFPGTNPVSKYTSDEWKLDGICSTVDPDLWFPEGPSGGFAAKKLCRTCPVITECLEYALENGEMFGIWGGMSTNERLKLRRHRRKLPEAI